MPSRNIPAYLVVLLMTACCSAQFLGGSHFASLVLAEQAAVNSNISCGRYFDDVQPASVAIRIYGNYTRKCYNVAETFSAASYDNNSLEGSSDRTLITCYPVNPACTTDFQAVGLNHYSPAANYSQVQADILFTSFDASIGQFEMRLFAGEACEDTDAEPWFSWGGCTESDREASSSCRELPYSVRSFRLDRGNGTGGCMVAAERGTGVQLSKASFAAFAGAVVLAGLMAVV